MTGQEFEVSVRAAGFTQKEFATLMGPHRSTIGKLFLVDEVPPHWIYALVGLIAGRALNEITRLVMLAGDNGRVIAMSEAVRLVAMVNEISQVKALNEVAQMVDLANEITRLVALAEVNGQI